MRVARLLFPALRADADGGFTGSRETIDTALEAGVGGFILFGGRADRVRDLTDELRARSGPPLLIGADLERGAGQQFDGATALPPAAALGALGDPAATRRAGELTAREARAVGVDWVYAPVADLDVEPENPIVATRAFSADPDTVARHVVAWIEGCRAAGALSCAKHFPGHGRTVTDSHIELPHVDAGRDALDADMRPFREAVRAGVDSVMTAHVAYPALDESAAPATLSRPIVTGLLREEVGFHGLVVTDALIMEGVLEGPADEGEAAVRALNAGCDALLYPREVRPAAAAIEAAVARGAMPETRVRAAVERVEASAARAASAPPPREMWGGKDDRGWALDIATRSLRVVRGEPRVDGRDLDLFVVDDDVGGPYPPPSREPFVRALREAGFSPEVVERFDGAGPLRGAEAADRSEPASREREPAAPGGAATADGRAALIALYADIRAWKGRPGISADARAAVRSALEAHPDAPVVLFGHPRLAGDVPGDHVLGAWGGEALMQEAAARWLGARGATGRG